MEKLTISCDSTADLSPELYSRYNIEIVSLGIVIGDKLYRDGVDVAPDDIYNAVEKLNIMPKSNAALEVDYADCFERNTKEGGTHLHFSISSKLSASHANALRAAKDYKNVHVIDSKNLSVGTGFLALMARELYEKGNTPAQIVEKMDELIEKIKVSFILDTLKYMHKGGRCSGFQLLGANLLKIHPQLVMDKEGYLVQSKRFSGNYAKVIKDYTKYIIESYPDADKEICFVSSSDLDQEFVRQASDEMRAAGFKRVINTIVGSVITTHCGRGTFGILVLDK